MSIDSKNSLQQFRFPSEDTIFRLIGPYPIESGLMIDATREKIIKIAVQFFANQRKNQEEIYAKVLEIVVQNAPDVSQNNQRVAAQDLTGSLMEIISGRQRSLWDPNAPGRSMVFYGPPILYS
jgi:hypothetical protein